ncbi:MAG TPA: metallophosphoesterase, partial [Chitinophagaceae bacterium]|nr:metallophosphoesterase [Chitinophagaceae bacterium]
MRNSFFWWLFIGFMVLLDFYFFQGLKTITHSASSRTRLFIFICYWTISIGAVLLLSLLPYLNFENKFFRNTIFACIAGLFFAKIIASSVFLIDDIRRGVQWIAGKVFFSNTEVEGYQAGEKISRSV